jgi:outer membrane protein TolC
VTDAIWTDDGYRQWETGLELPLWWPGQRKGRRDLARAARAASSHSERAHLLEVAGWVRQAVAELALAHVRLELTENEWRAEEALGDQIERAVGLQELAERDLLLARSSSLDRQLRYLEALEESQHAEGDYAILTGLSTWPADWAESPSELSTLREHPMLLLAEEETARAESEVRRLSRDQWGHPVLALGTQHERDGSGEDYDNRVIAGLRIPLGRRGDARADIAAAQRTLAETRRDARRLERQLRGALIQAEHRLALADDRVTTATEQAGMAAEYRRLSERGFALGETDLGTLLRARARAISAEQTLREAMILRQFGAAQFNQALGVVP